MRTARTWMEYEHARTGQNICGARAAFPPGVAGHAGIKYQSNPPTKSHVWALSGSYWGRHGHGSEYQTAPSPMAWDCMTGILRKHFTLSRREQQKVLRS
jgi:hypothetical protein